MFQISPSLWLELVASAAVVVTIGHWLYFSGRYRPEPAAFGIDNGYQNQLFVLQNFMVFLWLLTALLAVSIGGVLLYPQSDFARIALGFEQALFSLIFTLSALLFLLSRTRFTPLKIQPRWWKQIVTAKQARSVFGPVNEVQRGRLRYLPSAVPRHLIRPEVPGILVAEVVAWQSPYLSEELYQRLFSHRMLNFIRLRGQVQGDLRFDGTPPPSVSLEIDPSSGFSQTPDVSPRQIRQVSLIVDEAAVALVQTPAEDVARRHSWVLVFLGIAAVDLHFGHDTSGRPTITFGTANYAYQNPVTLTLDPGENLPSPRLFTQWLRPQHGFRSHPGEYVPRPRSYTFPQNFPLES